MECHNSGHPTPMGTLVMAGLKKGKLPLQGKYKVQLKNGKLVRVQTAKEKLMAIKKNKFII
jgi:hypothetical protein